MRRGFQGMLPALLALVLLAMLTACGGGGGGGSNGSGSSSGDGGSNDNSPSGASGLQYSGNTNPAVLTGANVAIFAANALGGGGTSSVAVTAGVGPAGSSQRTPGSGLAVVLRRLNQSLRATEPNGGSSRAVPARAASVDEIVPCDSGSRRRLGTTDGTGTISITYNDCRTGPQTLRGSATIRVGAFDFSRQVANNYTVTFSRLTVLEAGTSLDLSGTLRTERYFDVGIETLTIITANLVSLDNNTGNMTKSELVLRELTDNLFAPTSLAEDLSGRIFDGRHGYVNVGTNSQLFFLDESQLFPHAGEIMVVGAGNARIRVSVISSERVMLDLDLDGDGAFEASARLKWTDLSGPVGVDLGDTDGDGMHNSWETANGLNPADPLDAALDRDGDGASNKSEYRAGTDPNDRNSIPPAVSLAISLNASEPAHRDSNLTYEIVVRNTGAADASDVVVIDTLPAGVNFVSVTATGSTCTGTVLLICRFGTMQGTFGAAVITIVVTPTAEGVLSNTASVMTTSSFDPDLSNNTVTTTTPVGRRSLQALIDAAAPGSTITVEPGTYIGALDVRNNVTLESSGGPASTIITNGGFDGGITMRPGSAVKGFTIAGGGIEVNGSGAVISGNIFDNASRGRFSTAITGHFSASPLIERNVFRNHGCGVGASVVLFSGASSPQIVNNVFENNPSCIGVSMSQNSGTPQIINNVFVRNRAALSRLRGTYRNNIIVQNGIGLEADVVSTAPIVAVWENNLVFGNTTADYQVTTVGGIPHGFPNQTGTNGNISADPLFVDAPAGNYRLRAGSPAIDAGSAVGAPAVDFDGAPRPVGAGVDIGAFEVQ